ncbi:protein ATP6V1FNB [Betta splendens]|uniref:Protein ATP6V1FNB n=1 Tax=Betta splendens TaxID=158456 RepID=A0A9W2XTY1_BETSP|nr:protein ATP6V1FNB [Betta splendens]
MRYLLTTQSQGCYREQIQKEMLTRLAWRSRYASLYPSCSLPQQLSREPPPPADPRPVLPPPARTEGGQSHLPPPPHPPARTEGGQSHLPPPHPHPPARTEGGQSHLPPPHPHLPPPHPPARTEGGHCHLQPPHPHPPALSEEGDEKLTDTSIMRPASPQTRHTLYQDSSHHGRGRSLYLQRRGRIRPEERFQFPLLSSWEYGWRLGDYSLNYRTPSCARSPVVKNAFYARNGVFHSASATDALG